MNVDNMQNSKTLKSLILGRNKHLFNKRNSTNHIIEHMNLDRKANNNSMFLSE